MTMTRPSDTKRLQDAAKHGQEIVADPDGLRADLVRVVHEPRSDTDPMPWVHEYPGGWARRFKASQCYARLPLPLPAGTVVEHTMGGKRGLFVGPDADGLDGFVLVEFHPARGPVHTLSVSRNLLRRVTS